MTNEATTGTGLPEVDLGLGGEERECPECEHPADTPPRRPSIARKLLKMKPRPAECRVRVEDVSGMGSMACMCRHVSHGS